MSTGNPLFFIKRFIASDSLTLGWAYIHISINQAIKPIIGIKVIGISITQKTELPLSRKRLTGSESEGRMCANINDANNPVTILGR